MTSTNLATRRGISRYANKVSDMRLQFENENSVNLVNGTKNESAKSGIKLIGKNSLHMKRRTDHADGQISIPSKTSSGGISQIYSSNEGQQIIYAKHPAATAAWNHIK